MCVHEVYCYSYYYYYHCRARGKNAAFIIIIIPEPIWHTIDYFRPLSTTTRTRTLLTSCLYSCIIRVQSLRVALYHSGISPNPSQYLPLYRQLVVASLTEYAEERGFGGFIIVVSMASSPCIQSVGGESPVFFLLLVLPNTKLCVKL